LQLFDAYLIFASSAGAYLRGAAYGGNLGRQDHALIKNILLACKKPSSLLPHMTKKILQLLEPLLQVIYKRNLQVQ
jgi:hypothetical protein